MSVGHDHACDSVVQIVQNKGYLVITYNNYDSGFYALQVLAG